MEKKKALWSGDRESFKALKYTFKETVREAKQMYSKKLQHQF